MSDAPAASAPSTPAFEKLGLFYLGRRHDPATGQTLDEPVLYDSRDLVTHAVCVGMTGSGKTGLCLGPHRRSRHRRRAGHRDRSQGGPRQSAADLPSALARGVPSLGQRRRRPARRHERGRVCRRTGDELGERPAGVGPGRRPASSGSATPPNSRSSRPGSRAGRPVSILSSFSAPAAAEREDAELLAERASGTATSALVLAGVDAPPRSREHSLVAALLTARLAERRGPRSRRPDPAGPDARHSTRSASSTSSPSFPSKDRFELAMQLNGVLAAPGFETWLEGEPLDPQSLFYSPEGKPRVSIFSIAHLGDAERMFFVSLLMNQMVGWMRRQTGTTSLRAMVYMDEILGYFPPVSNPPSKPPLLTLLKQGRAFGLGIVLATQNPVDLDYKGLANTGTWFLGRLQTERDKARVLDGLEGVSGGLDRAEADRVLSGAQKARVPDAQRPRHGPDRFRDALDALLPSRAVVARSDQVAHAAGATGATAALGRPQQPRRSPVRRRPLALAARRPSGRRAGFGRRSLRSVRSCRPGFRNGSSRAPRKPPAIPPGVLGAARVSFSDRALGVDSTADVYYFAPVTDDAIQVDWAAAERLDIRADDLSRAPASPDGAVRAAPGGGGAAEEISGLGEIAQELARDRTSASRCSGIRRWVSCPGRPSRSGTSASGCSTRRVPPATPPWTPSAGSSRRSRRRWRSGSGAPSRRSSGKRSRRPTRRCRRRFRWARRCSVRCSAGKPCRSARSDARRRLPGAWAAA